MTNFDQDALACATDINRALESVLSDVALSGPGPTSKRLAAAMRHGSLNGGKRIRPLLVRQTAKIFGIPATQTLTASLAVEMVHCYSLIHDDLPAMDDDDLRRGQPTVHKAFDEATAILAGDSLLNHAFLQLAEPKCHPDANIRTLLISELAAGSGAGGMAGGQMRDLEGEKGGFSDADISIMQQMKTGALIRASVRMGAILGNAHSDALDALTTYSEAAGRAFQLADDILDETATPQQMGKATAKDADRGKPTLVARIGVESARRHLGDILHKAISALTPFGPEADGLRETAKFFANREN